jgi:hypothetical protein
MATKSCAYGALCTQKKDLLSFIIFVLSKKCGGLEKQCGLIFSLVEKEIINYNLEQFPISLSLFFSRKN